MSINPRNFTVLFLLVNTTCYHCYVTAWSYLYEKVIYFWHNQYKVRSSWKEMQKKCFAFSWLAVIWLWISLCLHCLVFRKKDLYLVITQKLTFMKSGGFHEIWQISCGFHEIRWISGEIWQISHEIHQISCRFHLKSGRFHVKSTYKTYKSNISRKTLQFYGVLWVGYVKFSHEIRRISKDQLPGMVSPMFDGLSLRDLCNHIY